MIFKTIHNITSTHRIFSVAAAALILCAGGCDQQKTGKGDSRSMHTRADAPQLEHVRSPIDNRRVRTQVLPIGSVPYDNMTLPMVSPNGKYIATQTGPSPDWNVLLAAPVSSPPVGARIEIYELKYSDQPALIATIHQPIILGRSCDPDGFLLEAPQTDGSRWIGKAKWTDGTIDWLVNDERVNAFASLGPDGRLAWSRREEKGVRFEFVVRHESEPWTLDATDGDWLFPSWSGRGDGLFVFRRAEGLLQLYYGDAQGPQAFQSSARRIEIVQGATMLAAYQAMAGHVNVVGGRPIPREELSFVHLTYNRVALWMPHAQRTPTVFAKDTLFGVTDETGHMIAMTPDGLIRQRIDNLNDRAELLAGRLAPRPIAHAQWMYVLLAPGDGRVGLTAMRLLPADSPLWKE